MALMIPRQRARESTRESEWWVRENICGLEQKEILLCERSSWDIFSCCFHIKHCHNCKKWHSSVVSRPPRLQGAMDNSPDLNLHVLCNLTHVTGSGYFSLTQWRICAALENGPVTFPAYWCPRFTELEKYQVKFLLHLPWWTMALVERPKLHSASKYWWSQRKSTESQDHSH